MSTSTCALAAAGEVELEVVDVQPRDRHLLLLARIGEEESKFLCGHDESALARRGCSRGGMGCDGCRRGEGRAPAQMVRDLIARRRPEDPFRRRNAAYLRQGEWFFVPAVGIAS